MSSLLRPVGPLPASVYWVRRALVLVVAVVLMMLLLKLFGSGGGDPKNSAATAPQPTPSSGPSSSPRSSPGPGADPTASRSATAGTPESPAPKNTPKDTKCDGPEVRIAVLPAARTVLPGRSLSFLIRLSAARDDCTATIDATRLSLVVRSGNDRIWTTSHCQQLIPRATLLLVKGKESSSAVVWDGRRSAPGCLPGQPVAKPGTYVAQAVFDGRASVEQAFQLKP